MTTLDLSDFDIEVHNQNVTYESKGRSGSWYEPSEPPVKEYIISTIILTDLCEYQDIEDVYALKPGMDIKLSLNWSAIDGEPLDFEFEGVVTVESVHVSEDRNEIEVGITAPVTWVGIPPRQSFLGR